MNEGVIQTEVKICRGTMATGEYIIFTFKHGKVVVQTHIYIDIKTAEITEIEIFSDYRDQGLGTEYYLYVEDCLKKEGFKRIIGEEKAFDGTPERTAHFLDKMGFKKIEKEHLSEMVSYDRVKKL